MASKQKNKKDSPFILRLGIILIVGWLLISCMSNAIKIHNLKAENQSLIDKHEEFKKENEHLKVIISGDKKEYMEHIARDKLGYAYPDEKIFYDVSPGDEGG